MADRFPDIPQTVSTAETRIDYSFEYLTACVWEGHAQGELFYPHGVAVDSHNNQIYVTEGFYIMKRCVANFARVSIFSETGEFLNTFSHPRMKVPYGKRSMRTMCM